MHPLHRWPETTVALPMRYGGSIAYWAAAAACGEALVDTSTVFNKRDKAVHRMDICDTHGPMHLTVPITLPKDCDHRPLRWSDIMVSAHGHWWSVHLTALESAYGRSPFFQFYIDRFLPFFSSRYAETTIPLAELLEGFDCQISDILGIPRLRYASLASASLADGDSKPIKDYRNRNVEVTVPVEYYQVRAAKFGFLGGLGILDLIFNMGPESPLVLKKIIKSLKEL